MSGLKKKDDMTDKELRRLSRMELIQLLLEQAKELERLQQELKEAQSALKSRELAIHKVGSIAEASLAVNQVMEAAQRAADQFLENTKTEYTRRAQKQYNEIRSSLDELEAATKAKCDAMLEEARRKAGAYGGEE